MNSTLPITDGDALSAAAARQLLSPLFIGCVLSVGLIGLMTLQVWLYYTNFPNDRMAIKVFVGVIWTIEVFRSSCAVHAAYHYSVSNWGHIEDLGNVVWSIWSLLLSTHVAAFQTRLFFARRIWLLGKPLPRLRQVLLLLVIVFTLLSFGAVVAFFIQQVSVSQFSAYWSHDSRIGITTSICAAIAADLTIMLGLVFLLSYHRAQSTAPEVLSQTNDILKMLMLYAVEASTITVVTDIIMLLLYLFNGRVSFDFIGPYELVGNLCGNSLLATLNARVALRTSNAGRPVQLVSALYPSEPNNSLAFRPTLQSTGVTPGTVEISGDQVFYLSNFPVSSNPLATGDHKQDVEGNVDKVA